MPRGKRQYKERRLYYSDTCEKCGKPFVSFKRARVRGGICKRKTCRYSVSDNQLSLLPLPSEFKNMPEVKIS